MTHLHSKFELEDLSLHTGMHVLDELFIHKPDLIDRDQIVVATTCLYIGCCYGETQAVNLSEWISSAGGHVAYDDIVSCLQTVNRTLNYPLVEVCGTCLGDESFFFLLLSQVGDIPVIILNDYLSQFRGLSFETRLRLSERARYVLELCLLNFDYKMYDVKRLVWTILFWVTTRDDSTVWVCVEMWDWLVLEMCWFLFAHRRVSHWARNTKLMIMRCYNLLKNRQWKTTCRRLEGIVSMNVTNESLFQVMAAFLRWVMLSGWKSDQNCILILPVVVCPRCFFLCVDVTFSAFLMCQRILFFSSSSFLVSFFVAAVDAAVAARYLMLIFLCGLSAFNE